MDQKLLDSIQKATSQESIHSLVDSYIREANNSSDQILDNVTSVQKSLQNIKTQIQYLQQDLKYADIVRVLSAVQVVESEINDMIEYETSMRQEEEEKIREEL